MRFKDFWSKTFNKGSAVEEYLRDIDAEIARLSIHHLPDAVGIDNRKIMERIKELEDRRQAIVQNYGMKSAVEKQDNPWAICNAQGLSGQKLEDCIMEVKEKMGMHKANPEISISQNSEGRWVVLCSEHGPEDFERQEDAENYRDVHYHVRHELGKMGVESAGPVPNSLLARQDLEGRRKEKSYSSFNSKDFEDAISRIKDQLSRTTNREERASLANDLRGVQEAKREAELAAEEYRNRNKKSETTKSFRDIWGRLRKSLSPRDKQMLMEDVLNRFVPEGDVDAPSAMWAVNARNYLHSKGASEEEIEEIIDAIPQKP